MDDAPTAEVGAEGDGSVRGQNDGPVHPSPVAGDLVLGQITGRVECSGNDTHGLLGVVAAMSETVSGCGQQLQATEPAVDALRRPALEYPHHGDHEPKTEHQAH